MTTLFTCTGTHKNVLSPGRDPETACVGNANGGRAPPAELALSEEMREVRGPRVEAKASRSAVTQMRIGALVAMKSEICCSFSQMCWLETLKEPSSSSSARSLVKPTCDNPPRTSPQASDGVRRDDANDLANPTPLSGTDDTSPAARRTRRFLMRSPSVMRGAVITSPISSTPRATLRVSECIEKSTAISALETLAASGAKWTRQLTPPVFISAPCAKSR
mmetsp:Transcript_2656/g.6329  ORF Transcript_2656/g.6329 Transcript_2656/m.6329 type:complete len:220 (-) Transcript_2656:1881-2540(-)